MTQVPVDELTGAPHPKATEQAMIFDLTPYTRTNGIAVKHNIEVAHRLIETPGKCEAIHGHSMWVTMYLYGEIDSTGKLAGIEYGDLKKLFRGYLDEEYDHRILLNRHDEWSLPHYRIDPEGVTVDVIRLDDTRQFYLPGLQTMEGDPTTENIAKAISEDMVQQMMEQGMEIESMLVEVWETSVNMATHGIGY